MEFPIEESSSKNRTVYAKPFPKSTTTEDYVKQIFGVFGSIRRVKLRREAPTNSFRGSVYVEFTDAAAALAAVANPPHAPPSEPAASPHRLHVMLKTEYERKRSHASTSARDGGGEGAAAGDGGGGGSGGGGSSRGHKRAKRRSEMLPGSPSHRNPRELPPPPPPLPLPPPHTPHNPQLAGDCNAATSPRAQQQRLPQPQPSSQHKNAHPQRAVTAAAGVPVTVPAADGAPSHWRQVAEEREAAMRSLEEALRKEKKDSQQLYQRLAEAQQRVQEAAAREAAANQKVLARDVEIGSLKGEISMLRTQGAAQLERQGASHKARITELEASMQRLKDALMEKERGEREVQRKAAAAAAAAAKENSSERRGGSGGSGGGAGGRAAADITLDEL